ncbi:MAG: hypothetical protein V3T88_07455, partial [Nitrosomonadaceae bacterium]
MAVAIITSKGRSFTEAPPFESQVSTTVKGYVTNQNPRFTRPIQGNDYSGNANLGDSALQMAVDRINSGLEGRFNFFSGSDVGTEYFSCGTGNIITRNRQSWSVIGAMVANTTAFVNDSRVFTKDNGTSESNHTLMMGIVNTGDRPRCRVGFGGLRASSTLFSDGSAGISVDGTLNLLMITYDGATMTMHHIDGTGTHFSDTEAKSGDLTNNTDAVTIGRSAGAADNYMKGYIPFIFAFDGEVLNSQQLRSIWREPWQVFDPPEIFTFPTATATSSAALTGTATATIDEADIVTGGKTIIITLTGDTFKAAGTGPIGSTADTQALIDGFDAASSPTNGLNNEVRDKSLTSEVVRTSDTVATWTIGAK